MAVNDTVRGLKGTITKQQQEIRALEDRIAHLVEEAGDAESEKNNIARRLASAERLMEQADSKAEAHKARADQLERELERSRSLELDAVTKLRVSEAERYRLNGYIQRVAEDDAAREGLVEVADSRSIRRRPEPPLSHGPDYGSSYNIAGSNDMSPVFGGHRRY